MTQTQRSYLPAAGRDWALPLYDPFVKLLGIEILRRELLNQAGLRPAHRVLDIGCGTGSLATMINGLQPGVSVVGLDPDPKALERARKKAGREGVSIQFDEGFADALPYADGSFDRVLSSFMFHHLPAEQKEQTLREVRRVLAAGGSLHLLDFAAKESRTGGSLARWLHSSHHLRDNTESRILTLMREAGFASWEKLSERPILLGILRIAYYQASV
jgi:ubiquinone/menaquinone biosynthesis C-methylase UbiE